MASKTFVDQVAPVTGRVYEIIPTAEQGKYHIRDITSYIVEGTPLGAEFLNGLQDGTYPAGTANALTTPRKIGNANFDGTADITLDQIGALPNLQPNSFTTATPITGTDLSSVTVKYSKVGDFVFLFGVATIGTTENRTINVASGLPIPSANYYGNKIAPITASSNFVANARVGGDGKLVVYLANAAFAGNNIYFSGFYFAD